MHSYISLDTQKNDIEFYTSLEVFEDLTKDKQSRHEFIYPNYTIQKRSLTEKGNDVILKSYGSQRKYNTNIYEGILINDFEFNISTQRLYSKQRLCEVYFMTEYLERKGVKINWTLAQSWEEIAKRFVLIL